MTARILLTVYASFLSVWVLAWIVECAFAVADFVSNVQRAAREWAKDGGQ